MDTKSKILFAVLLLAILVSIYFTYDRTIVRKDFERTQSDTSVIEKDIATIPETIKATSTLDVSTTTPVQ